MENNQLLPSFKINVSDFVGNYRVDNEVEVFLMVVSLHLGGEINKERMLSLLKKVRTHMNSTDWRVNGSLDLFTNKKNINWVSANFKCWYNDDTLRNVIREVYEDRNTKKKVITFGELLTYVSLLLNKPFNYCLDWVRDQIVLKVLPQDYDASAYIFNNLGIVVEMKSFDDFEVFGYCCEDCDGDYNQYKSNYYERDVLEVTKKKVAKVFESLKKPQTKK